MPRTDTVQCDQSVQSDVHVTTRYAKNLEKKQTVTTGAQRCCSSSCPRRFIRARNPILVRIPVAVPSRRGTVRAPRAFSGQVIRIISTIRLVETVVPSRGHNDDNYTGCSCGRDLKQEQCESRTSMCFRFLGHFFRTLDNLIRSRNLLEHCTGF